VSSNVAHSSSQSVPTQDVQVQNLNENNHNSNNNRKYNVDKSSQTFFGQWDHVVSLPNENAIASNELILSVNNANDANANLPLIDVMLFQTQFPFLLDSGSSISIFAEKFFQDIKSFTKYKFLARNIAITTINSKVHFSGCIEIAFKIQSLHFKHNFFLVDIPGSSQFKGILGIDFLNKHAGIIDFANNTVKIKNEIIKFTICNNAQLHHIQENLEVEPQTNLIVNSCSSSKSEKKCEPNEEEYENQINVLIANKVTVPPNSNMTIEVRTTEVPTAECAFWPVDNNNSNISYHPSIHFCNPCNATQSSIFIVAKNSSNKHVHLRKGSTVGHLIPLDSVDIFHTNVSHNENSQIHLIQASSEIKNLREQEFNINNFQLNHLKPQDKLELENLLSEFKQIFSSSMKSLGETDLVTPELNFTSNFPLKCPPFPIPQALLADAKEQLQEMEKAGKISHTISDWASPLLLVKKKPSPDGKQTYRLALDLRLLNTVLTSSAYPLPTIPAIIRLPCQRSTAQCYHSHHLLGHFLTIAWSLD
jgi:hypothetical protein